MRGGSASPSVRNSVRQSRLSTVSNLNSTLQGNMTSTSILNTSSFIQGTGDQNIRVAARVRPKTSKEVNAGPAVHVNEQNVVEGSWPTEMIVTSSNAIVHNGKQKFRFDAVFPAHATQEAVFEEMAAPLVRAVCSGYNAALFAYGQTGTGKTHTMLGEDIWMLASNASKELSTKQRDTLENSEMRGVIPRAMKLLFLLLRDKQHKVSVSYLEIYNEKILDLLNPTSSEGLEIREDKQGNVQAVDCTIKRVSSVNEVFDYLWKGARNRAVSSTDMNEHSSRSHTIFQVLVETRGMNGMPGTKAKLNLVDLAGSEKWRPHQLSEFSDQRIMEMTSINQSLSNLGNCVRGLLRPGKTHIPFRNSKLTRLLQDSLGGNALTGFVVTVSPSELAHEETISTLQFADRVKRVHVKAEQNVVETPESLLKKVEAELAKVREENRDLKQKLEAIAAAPKEEENTWTTANIKETGGGIGQVLRKCFGSAGDAGASSEDHELLLSKPEKFLQDYHDHLRQRKSDSLQPAERLALVEWSVCLQAEELETFKTRVEDQERDLKAKETQLGLVSRQLLDVKAALDGERSKVVELEMEKEQFIQEVSSLKEKLVEVEQQAFVEKQKQKSQATIYLRNPSKSSTATSPAVVVIPSATSNNKSGSSSTPMTVGSTKPKAIVIEPQTTTATVRQRGRLEPDLPTSLSSKPMTSATTTSTRRPSSEVAIGVQSLPAATTNTRRPSNEAAVAAPTTTLNGRRPSNEVMPMEAHSSSRRSSLATPQQGMPSPIPHVQAPVSTTKNISFNSSRANRTGVASSASLLTPMMPQRSSLSSTLMSPPPPPPPTSSSYRQHMQVWDRFVDDASGKPYYHCKETGQTTWKRPGGGVSGALASNGALIVVRGE